MLLKYQIFTIIWAFIILVMSLAPGSPVPSGSFFMQIPTDKVIHTIVYALLILLAIIGCRKQYQYFIVRLKAKQYSFLAVLGYGLLIELIQTLIPQRSFESGDVLANLTGCLLGTGLFYLIYRS